MAVLAQMLHDMCDVLKSCWTSGKLEKFLTHLFLVIASATSSGSVLVVRPFL